MAISKEKKAELIALYKDKIENSTALVFTDYRGSSVPQMQSLRAKLKETGANYMVVKNRLFGLALNEVGLPQPEELLTDPNAIVFLDEDISTGVKALQDWIKADEVIEVKGGLLKSSVLDSKGVDSLTNLPTKEQTQAMLLGVISAPSGQLVRVLNAPISSLVRVLNAPIADLTRVLAARAEQMKNNEA